MANVAAPVNKILIIGPAWVGDMVMAQTLFKVLKQQNPEVVIDVLAPDWSRPLLARMPEVRQSLTMPIGHGKLCLKERYQIGKLLRQEHYEQSIVLPNSWKSALIPFWAKIHKRTGWLGEQRWGLLNDIRFLDKKRLPLMVQRFMALGLARQQTIPEDWQSPGLQIAYDALVEVRQRYGLVSDENPILALCPGAEFGPAKRWPAEYYADVARQKLSEGWQVWIFGSKNDQPVAQEIQDLTEQRCRDLTGRTSLGDAIDLLSLAAVVVTNDSGLMHIAAALQRPIIVMYGSTDPGFTPPLAEKVKILRLGLPCSPCFKRECPLPPEQHLRCLKDLKPEQVLNALDELSNASAPR